MKKKPMHRLVLIRHAKSDWSDNSLMDIERPLSARGRQAAPLMGKWLSQQNIEIDRVLCSPALRAQQSWSSIAEQLSFLPPLVEEQSLYRATYQELMQIIQNIPENLHSVAVVAHNPGLQDLALSIASKRQKIKSDHSVFEKYPTCAISIFALRRPWNDLRPGACLVEVAESPKRLEKKLGLS